MVPELFGRLHSYLNLSEDNPAHVRMISAYAKTRVATLERFPLLMLAMGAAEQENADNVVRMVEATLWEIAWIDRLNGESDCVDSCRGKLATFLEWIDSGHHAWVRDPAFISWVVIASLEVEKTAHRKGLSKMFGSKEANMIDALLRDCNGRVASKRPLPNDLLDRLADLQRNGVFLNSDLPAAVKLALSSNET